jgi:hypothetical protein
MLGQRYRIRFTLHRFPGMVVVCCDRWPAWTTSAPTPQDAIWEAAARAVYGQG